MQIEKIKVSDLKPADYNPRKKLKPGDKEFEKLKKSIEEFGYDFRAVEVFIERFVALFLKGR